jgi:predicted metal-dependent hydrolase
MEAPSPLKSSPLDAKGGPPVEVRTSARRRTTATAFQEGERIVVVVPERLARRQRDEVVQKLVKRMLARREAPLCSDIELLERSVELITQFLPELEGCRLTSVRYVTNQQRRWASATPLTGEIRVAASLRAVPSWVLDAVLVHELAHFLEQGHTPRFRRLEARHPRFEQAKCFLEGYACGLRSSGASQPSGWSVPDPGDEGVERAREERRVGSADVAERTRRRG